MSVLLVFRDGKGPGRKLYSKRAEVVFSELSVWAIEEESDYEQKFSRHPNVSYILKYVMQLRRRDDII